MKPALPFFAGSTLTEPRVNRNRRREFEEIMFIALAAILCGAEKWNAITDYGRSKEKRLKTFLQLKRDRGMRRELFYNASLGSYFAGKRKIHKGKYPTKTTQSRPAGMMTACSKYCSNGIIKRVCPDSGTIIFAHELNINYLYTPN